jgi:hypothetical protein
MSIFNINNIHPADIIDINNTLGKLFPSCLMCLEHLVQF